MLERTGRVAALICGLALSGCGADNKEPSPKSTETPSPTTTSTPSPTKPVAEKPVLPDATKGKKGQEAFATYVVNAWAYSLATNEASILKDVSAGTKPCRGCIEQTATLAERAKEGWYVYPFEVTISKIRLIRTALGTTARVRFDIPETRSFFDDGKFRNTSPAHTGATFTVSMKLDKKKYQLVGFTIS